MKMYEEVRKATDPEKTLLSFLETTYDAAAKTGNWQKKEFEFNFAAGLNNIPALSFVQATRQGKD